MDYVLDGDILAAIAAFTSSKNICKNWKTCNKLHGPSASKTNTVWPEDMQFSWDLIYEYIKKTACKKAGKKESCGN
jgi:hypothetical protein